MNDVDFIEMMSDWIRSWKSTEATEKFLTKYEK